MPLHRFLLDANAAFLSPTNFTTALNLLPPPLHPKIASYHFPTDRRLALSSALLQRYIFTLPSLNPTPFTLSTVPLTTSPTSGRPHLSPSSTPRSLIRDYNTTHHNPRESPLPDGQEKALVAVVASTHGRVGIDLVATRCKSGTEKEWVNTFDDNDMGVFTLNERAWVRAEQAKVSGNKEGVMRAVEAMMLLWGLKEAYVKATGMGLSERLTRVEFSGMKMEAGEGRWGEEVVVRVDGVVEEWWVEVGRLGGRGTEFWVVVCAEGGGERGEWREVGWEELRGGDSMGSGQ